MAGRFPLLTDENVSGPIIEALLRRDWDVARAVDLFGERTKDDKLMQDAVQVQRVLATTDNDFKKIGVQWLRAWRLFPGLVLWTQEDEQRMTVGDFVAAFEALAATDNPFAYPIQYIKPPG